MTEELKPCPFCGYDQPEVIYAYRGSFIHAYVECGNCEARGPIEALTDDLPQAAINAWNERRTQ